uniref:Resistin-like beta n=1 Tax=Balaenoptera musculus TaxID=9771 RepID=A0A8C0CC51_BALMU
MKLNFCFLLILLFLLQMTIPGSAQCSLDAIVDKKIKDALTGDYEWTSSISKSKGSLVYVSCAHAGSVVTGCACGYGCGSWDLWFLNILWKTICHYQCAIIDWTTACCCHLL